MNRIEKIKHIYIEKFMLFQKWTKEESLDFFNKLTACDPTFSKKYLRWLCDIFLNHGFLEEDIEYENNKVFETLTLFSKLQNKLEEKDRILNKYNSIGTLWNVIKPYIKDYQEKEDYNNQIHNDTKIIIRTKKQMETENGIVSGNFIVVNPLTEESAKWWGKGTRWCTSADNNNMFNTYAKQAPLFVIIMPNGDKLQLWKNESNLQFMDENDSPILNDYIEKHFSLLEPVFQINNAFLYYPLNYLKKIFNNLSREDIYSTSDYFISNYLSDIEKNISMLPDFLIEKLFDDKNIYSLFYGNKIEKIFLDYLFNNQKITSNAKLFSEFETLLKEIDWHSSTHDEFTNFLKNNALKTVENERITYNIPELISYNKYLSIKNIKYIKNKKYEDLTDLELFNFESNLRHIVDVMYDYNIDEIPVLFLNEVVLHKIITSALNALDKKNIDNFFCIEPFTMHKQSNTNSFLLEIVQKIEKIINKNILTEDIIEQFAVKDFIALSKINLNISKDKLINILLQNPRCLENIYTNIKHITLPENVIENIIMQQGHLLKYFLHYNFNEETLKRLVEISLQTDGIFNILEDAYLSKYLNYDKLNEYYFNAIDHDLNLIRYVPDTFDAYIANKINNTTYKDVFLKKINSIRYLNKFNLNLSFQDFVENYSHQPKVFNFRVKKNLLNWSQKEKIQSLDYGIDIFLEELKKNNYFPSQEQVVQGILHNSSFANSIEKYYPELINDDLKNKYLEQIIYKIKNDKPLRQINVPLISDIIDDNISILIKKIPSIIFHFNPKYLEQYINTLTDDEMKYNFPIQEYYETRHLVSNNQYVDDFRKVIFNRTLELFPQENYNTGLKL
jgi:hypothetical protein